LFPRTSIRIAEYEQMPYWQLQDSAPRSPREVSSAEAVDLKDLLKIQVRCWLKT
jgi:hypothetical protein